MSNTKAAKATTLNIDLTDPLFINLGRRKYTEKYTKIPLKAYPEEVLKVFEALYRLVKLELTDETTSISVLASAEGFPQRLIGPKVFQVGGKLGVKIDKEFYAFDKNIVEDEIKYSLNGKSVTLQAEGKNPLFKVTLGSGLAIKLPVYMNINETAAEGESAYYGFKDLEESLSIFDNEEYIVKQVGAPSAGGSTVFTALKHLPIGSYTVISAKNAAGKFGPVLNLIIKPQEEIEVVSQIKNPATEKWENQTQKVSPDICLKIQGNTALKNSLMGAELSESDKVLLIVSGQSENKEGKTIVQAAFDYSESPLKFEF